MTGLEPLTPFPEQQAMIDAIVAEPTRAALVAAGTGAGKTLTAVESAKGLGAQTVLVIAPLNTRVGWEATFKRQGVSLPIHRIDSSKAGKQAHQDLYDKVPGVYLIGWEYFRRFDWTPYKPDLVIADESHKSQNRKSTTYKMLRTLRAGFKIAMSATPAGNRFEGIWAPCRWLWPSAKNEAGQQIVSPHPWKWAAQWAMVVDDHFAGKKITGEREPGAFVKTLPCYFRPEPRVTNGRVAETVLVELSPAQRKMYTQMQRDMVAWLEGHPLVAELPITMRTRLRQMTLGTVQITEDGEVDFADDTKSSKIEALQEILEEHEGEPVMIYTDSARFARVVAKRLGAKAVAWTGQMPHSERERVLETFGTPQGPQYIVATIAAIGEGVDGAQSRCHIEVWMSRSENGILNQQAEGRLNRTGQTETVLSYDIAAVDTYDLGTLGSLVEQRLQMNVSLKREEESR